MKSLLVAALLCSVTALAAAPKVYIQPDGGYESYLAGAIIKKHVPVTIVNKRSEADYVLESHVVSHQESGFAKFSRCAFAACSGISGKQVATVELVQTTGDQIIWAYNVRKGRALNYQSTAEAVAKHLKKFLKKHDK